MLDLMDIFILTVLVTEKIIIIQGSSFKKII